MEANKRKNSFVIQGSILAIASILVRIIGVLYRIPIVKCIGDEGMGYYSAAYEVYSIVLILSSYSLPIAVSKLVSARVIRKKYKDSHRVLLGSLVFALIAGSIAGLVIYFGADYFASYTNYPKSSYALKTLAPTLLIVAVMGVLRGYFQGKGTMIPTAVSQIIEQIVNAIVSVIAAAILIAKGPEFGAAGGTIGTGVGALFGLIFLIFTFISARPIINKEKSRDLNASIESFESIAKTLLITISPVLIASTIYNITGIIDITMFGRGLASHNYTEKMTLDLLGIYNGKYKIITNLPISLASGMAASIIPSITAAMHNKRDDVNKKIDAGIKFIMLIAIPSFIGVAVLAQPILRLIFSDARMLPARILQLGAITIVFYSVSTISNAILQGINHLNIPIKNAIIAMGVKVVFNYILLYAFDTNIYGLVISSIIFSAVVSILNAFAIRKITGFMHDVRKTFIIPTIASLIMGVAAYATYTILQMIININAISTILAIGVAIIVYFIAIIRLKGIDETEILGFPKGYQIISVMKKFHLI